MPELNINLKNTQKGYVPLEDRFKSFPPDSANMPVTDFRLFFDGFANGRLERSTLDLLYPIPKWLRRKLKGINQPFLMAIGSKKFFMANGKFLIASEK